MMLLLFIYVVISILIAFSITFKITDSKAIGRQLASKVFKNEKILRSDKFRIGVYNAASDANYDHDFEMRTANDVVHANPVKGYLWSTYTYAVQNLILFHILTLILHVLPAIIIDGISLLLGKKPRLLKIYRRIFIANVSLEVFMSKTFTIKTDHYIGLENVIPECDKATFSFTRTRLKINSEENKEVLGILWRGVKRYLLNLEIQATEAEVKRYARVMVCQKVVFSLIQGFAVFLIITKMILPWATHQLHEIIL